MKNNPKTLKTLLLSLSAALTLAAPASASAAEKTNAAAMSAVQKLYVETLPKAGMYEAHKRYAQGLATVGKTGEWKDPDKVLADVRYDGLPVSEIALNLLDRFDHQFDILLPKNWEGVPGPAVIDANTGLPIPQAPQEARDWVGAPVDLRLKNVTASEVFNAMNLFFEINGQPLRWELMLNGHRPTALLRVVELPALQAAPKPPEETKRAIFYVGELVGDEKSGGMTMKQIIETLQDVSFADYKKEVAIQCHEGAQMLVVKGTPGEVELVRDTIEALKQKAKVDAGRKQMEKVESYINSHSKAAESKPGVVEPKNP